MIKANKYGEDEEAVAIELTEEEKEYENIIRVNNFFHHFYLYQLSYQ